MNHSSCIVEIPNFRVKFTVLRIDQDDLAAIRYSKLVCNRYTHGYKIATTM
jgi:hypothetical protein